jgi:hypothetical protein
MSEEFTAVHLQGCGNLSSGYLPTVRQLPVENWLAGGPPKASHRTMTYDSRDDIMVHVPFLVACDPSGSSEGTLDPSDA